MRLVLDGGLWRLLGGSTLVLGAGLALLMAVQPVTGAAEARPPQPASEGPAPATLPEGHLPWPVRAEFVAPTDRYPHGILGRIPGWGGLLVDLKLCRDCDENTRQLRIDLPDNRVFEDIAPRLWDIAGDGRPEIVVVESDAEQGARLAVWEVGSEAGSSSPLLALRAATPFIGTRFRWLAPLGAADFTGDGVAEIAYVEKPHLDRVLRLVAFRGDQLIEVARLDGVTNHTIGEETIHGGIRHCDGGPEIVAFSADREAILAIRLEEGKLVPRVLGPAGSDGIPRELLTCDE